MTGPSRMSIVAVTGLLCALCSQAPALASDPGQRTVIHVQSSRSAPPRLTLDPGPIPPRRVPLSASAEVALLPVEQAIQQCVENDMQAISAPGAAVTVILDGQVIFSRGFGVKRLGRTDPVNATTRFRIGSVTKMLTAAAVMHQVDLGRVDLDAPARDWIPELGLNGRWSFDSITVRHLLTHSAAVPDHFENPFDPTGDHALAQWAGSLDGVLLLAPPGGFWNYSNPGYCLAGLVAERAGGMHYRELVKTTVLDRAAMNATTFSPAEAIASRDYTFGHDWQGGQLAIYAPDDYDSWLASPSGLAFSTALDLARWALLLMDGGGIVLSPSSAAAMQQRQIGLDHIPGLDYGFGVFAERYNGLDVRQHGGNIPGWGAWLLWVPERRFAVAVLANTTMSLSAAAYCIVDAVLEPEPSPPHDYSTDPATWGRYAGSYRLLDDEGTAFEADVRKTGDRFFVTILDPDRRSVLFSSDLVQKYLDTFYVDGGFASLEPDLTIQPTVTFIDLDLQGRRSTWLRNRGLVGERLKGPRRPSGRRAPDES